MPEKTSLALQPRVNQRFTKRNKLLIKVAAFIEPFQIHNVPKSIKPERLQEYGVGLFDLIPTKSALKKALKRQQIKVNDVVASTATLIKGGESITFYKLESSNEHKSLDLKLEVLFEDDYIAAINKPPGILVSANTYKTIANALVQNITKSLLEDSTTPQPVHRLDYATTGVLLAGKTSQGIRRLNKLFEDKQIEKVYYAITIGAMSAKGEMNSPIDGKDAHTDYEVLKTVSSVRFEYLNLVKLTPKTGRRHQLRKHLSNMGNAILGDRDYSPEGKVLQGKGMYLHAQSLRFDHPFMRQKILIKSKLPKPFVSIFGAEIN